MSVEQILPATLILVKKALQNKIPKDTAIPAVLSGFFSSLCSFIDPRSHVIYAPRIDPDPVLSDGSGVLDGPYSLRFPPMPSLMRCLQKYYSGFPDHAANINSGIND